MMNATQTSSSTSTAQAPTMHGSSSMSTAQASTMHGAAEAPPPSADPHQTYDADMESLIQSLVKFGVHEQRLRHRLRELHDVSRSMQIRGVDVSEIYSPPRVTAMAMKLGLIPGTAFDIQVNDENGHPWDFTDPLQRKRAK